MPFFPPQACAGLTLPPAARMLPPVPPFPMESQRITFEQQSIHLQGVANARDLGGYVMADGRRIRPGRLLRSGNLFTATDADLERLEKVYRVRQIIDFRTEGEAEKSPDRPVPGAGYMLLPTIEPAKDEWTGAVGQALARAAARSGEMRGAKGDAAITGNAMFMELARSRDGQALARAMYPRLLFSEFTQLQYATFLNRVAATEDGAILWHCAQGKDRTGIGSALLLAALGADRELILADFDMSNLFYRELLDTLSAHMRQQGCEPAALDALHSFIGVNTARFAKALELVDREFGSLHNYLVQQVCLGEDDMARLQDMFLE